MCWRVENQGLLGHHGATKRTCIPCCMIFHKSWSSMRIGRNASISPNGHSEVRASIPSVGLVIPCKVTWKLVVLWRGKEVYGQVAQVMYCDVEYAFVQRPLPWLNEFPAERISLNVGYPSDVFGLKGKKVFFFPWLAFCLLGGLGSLLMIKVPIY